LLTQIRLKLENPEKSRWVEASRESFSRKDQWIIYWRKFQRFIPKAFV
jgi:hypothetical protein